MNVHLLLQMLGTCFVFWNVYDAWVMLWRVPIQWKKQLRYACLRLVLWSGAAGLSVGYWLEKIP